MAQAGWSNENSSGSVTRRAPWVVCVTMSAEAVRLTSSPGYTRAIRIDTSRWWVVPLATLGGVAWGAAARGWMRLLSTDPEFTWSGTLFILGFSAVVWTGGGIAAVTRHRRSAARKAGTIVGGLMALLLGFGQGMLLLPTALAGGLLLGRRRRKRAATVALAIVAVAPVLLLLVMLWREPELSVPRRLLITLTTPMLCAALCIPYSYVLGHGPARTSLPPNQDGGLT